MTPALLGVLCVLVVVDLYLSHLAHVQTRGILTKINDVLTTTAATVKVIADLKVRHVELTASIDGVVNRFGQALQAAVDKSMGGHQQTQELLEEILKKREGQP